MPTASTKGIQAKHAARLQVLLTVLEHAEAPSDVNQPGFGLHPLKGSRKGDWSMRVQANWRLTFRFTEQGVELLGVSRKTVSELVNGRAPVTAEMAMRIALVFDSDPGFWLRMQAGRDAWEVHQREKEIRREVTTYAQYAA